jgi:plastocyanin
MFRLAPVALAVCAACGSSDTQKKIDAPAQAQTVQMVTCPGTPAATIMTDASTFAYQPNAVTITQGQVVKFVMASIHDVEPNTSGSDPGLRVGFGATTCLMFTQSGTFGFHCGPHQFTGTVTVQ